MPVPNPVRYDQELSYYVAFNRAGFIGPVRFRQLLKKYGTAREAWLKLDRPFLRRLGLSEKVSTQFMTWRPRVRPELLRDRALAKVDQIFILGHPQYPPSLINIPDAPYIIYVKGRLLPEDTNALAVVGSRKISRYGQQVVLSLVGELAASGLTIVSGLAFGVDAAAHRAALEVGGRTLAVLASGVDLITPTANTPLGRRIIKSGRGAILSERPIGSAPFKSSFPVRNRLIAGLSLSVLVVEAAIKSGSLHTVQAALEQGKDVMAVPGSIFSPTSAGTNYLIQQGAKLARTAQDVLEELSFTNTSRSQIPVAQAPSFSDKEEGLVFSYLAEAGDSTPDQIARATSLPVASVSVALTMLEMSGHVSGLGGLWQIRVGR